jgi:hypothetical protein
VRPEGLGKLCREVKPVAPQKYKAEKRCSFEQNTIARPEETDTSVENWFSNS